eukprot:340279-Rhodomonas_salina.1
MQRQSSGLASRRARGDRPEEPGAAVTQTTAHQLEPEHSPLPALPPTEMSVLLPTWLRHRGHASS